MMDIVIILVLCFFFLDYQSNIDCAQGCTKPMSSQFPATNKTFRLKAKRTPTPHSQDQNQIPKLIIQTNERDEMPHQMMNSIEELTHRNPEFGYWFVNSTQRREYIRTHMDTRVLRAYDRLIPKAYQADLFRYSIIYNIGGCYMDTGSYTIKKLSKLIRPSDRFISTIDFNGEGVNSAFFCASKNHPILQMMIDDAVSRIEKGSYGISAIDVTGPLRFAHVLKKYAKIDANKSLHEGEYGEGIRLYNRVIGIGCLIAQLRDGVEPFVISKYPSYYSDYVWYVKQPTYQELWKSHQVYKS